MITSFRSHSFTSVLRAIAGCLAIFIFCTPPPRETTAPKLSAEILPAYSATPVPSFINVPVRMKTRVVEEMLNKQLPELLYECDTLNLGVAKGVKIKVRKGDSVRITLHGDELRYTVPLRLWLQFSFSVGAFGLTHTEYQDVEAAIALSFRSRLFVKNDWNVVTMTQPEGFEWITDPVIRVRFLTIPIKLIADWLLSNQQKTFCGIIDKEINTIFNVKQLLRPLWLQIQNPIELSVDPKAWLRLTPQAVYMTQLDGIDGTIMSSVGIKSVAETFFGEQPSFTRQDSLPDFIIPGKIDSSFVINLYGEMSYTAAENLLRGYLAGRNFTFGRKEIVIEDITVTGLQGYAVIGLDLVGSYRGRIYVVGQPVFDSATSTVSIENLDFDLSTKNVAHNATNWLLHGIIISKVKPFLKFPLKEKLLESQLMVQKMLCHSEIMKNVYITGAIDSLAVGGVQLTDRAIQAIVFARGTLLLSVHD